MSSIVAQGPLHPAKRVEEIRQVCRARGLPFTLQRRAITRALLRHTNHPTADQIYQYIRTRVPGLSRPTVYRTLETLVRIGVARKVCHPGAAARYDAKTQRHHHLVCLQCGKMVDLEDASLDTIPLPVPGYLGFDIADYSIQFRGMCRDCRADLSRGRRAGLRDARRGRRARSRKERRKT
jgi:Fur family peroxide stress response transcriptional regulator